MSILVAVPTFETICPETFRSIYGLLPHPDKGRPMFDFIKGYDCAKARNEIAKEAIKYDFEYVLFVDSDIIVPSDALLHLLETPVDICLGLYPRKNTKCGETEVFKTTSSDFVDRYTYSELEGLDRINVKGGGFGCTLVKTSLFKRMVFPWFQYYIYPSGDVLSEDNYFCNKASSVGAVIQADARVHCKHLVRHFIER